MLLVSTPSCPGGMRGEDRGEIGLGETLERRCVTERPINPLDPMQPGQRDSVGHLHLHPRGPGSSRFDEPQTCPFAKGEKLDLGRVAALGCLFNGPTGRGG